MVRRPAPALVLLLLAGAMLAGCSDDAGPAQVRCPRVPPDAGTVLHGEVYRSDGAAARGAFIEARGPFGVVVHTMTKASPCFALRVQAGEWAVVASQSGWAGNASATVHAGEAAGMVIVMRPV